MLHGNRDGPLYVQPHRGRLRGYLWRDGCLVAVTRSARAHPGVLNGDHCEIKPVDALSNCVIEHPRKLRDGTAFLAMRGLIDSPVFRQRIYSDELLESPPVMEPVVIVRGCHSAGRGIGLVSATKVGGSARIQPVLAIVAGIIFALPATRLV